jgi:hypothetical protein
MVISEDLSSWRNRAGEEDMRSYILAAAAVVAFAGSFTVSTNEANAVVCARGVARAGCVATPRAAVVAKPVVVTPVVTPAVTCRYVVVNGVRVRRCV